jgi:hypothetical protein
MIDKKADGILELFWKHDAGPIENILGLVEYGYMFLGGFWGKAAITIATILGVSLRNLGKKLDEMFSLTSLEDLANLPDNIDQEALFNASLAAYKPMIEKLGRSYMDKQTAFELLFGGKTHSGGLLSVLKTVAIKILGGGLLSFLTLKGVQAAKRGSTETADKPEDTNNTTEREIERSKNSLESAIKEALAS